MFFILLFLFVYFSALEKNGHLSSFRIIHRSLKLRSLMLRMVFLSVFKRWYFVQKCSIILMLSLKLKVYALSAF